MNNTVKEYRDKTGSARFCNTDSPLFISLPGATGKGAELELRVKEKLLRVEPEELGEAEGEMLPQTEEQTPDEALLYPKTLCGSVRYKKAVSGAYL